MMKKILLLLLLFAEVLFSAVPIADYHMDECQWDGTAGEVLDQSGNYNAKVDIAGTTTTVFMGRINRAGAFNQNGVTNSAIALPPAVLNGKSDFTFTVWLYPTTALQSKQTFLSAENGPNTDEDDLLFRIKYNSNNLNLKYDGNGNNSNSNQIDFALTANDIPAGTWTFLALTKTGNTACVAINDTGYDCQTVPEGTDPLSIQYLLLAQDSAGGSTQSYYANSAFPGRMDEVKFYDTALSQSELDTIYQNEKAGKNYDGSNRSTADACIVADYRMDECFYLDGANGADDVFDSSTPPYNAQSVNRLDSNLTSAKICRSGAFGDGSYAVVSQPFTLGTQWTLSVWLNFPFVKSGQRYYVLGSYTGTGDIPVFQYKNNTTLEWGVYDNSGNLQWNSIDNSLSGWHHLVFLNDGAKTTLYVDKVLDNSINLGTSGEVSYLWTSTDDLGGQAIASKLDEMKLFDYVLSPEEIAAVYDNENAGLNYDGTIRDCPACNSAPIKAKTWKLVGIPADLRSDPKTVSDIFGDDLSGTYGTDWRIYRRDYSDTNNSSWYTYMNLSEPLVFGQGYWLGSKNDGRWDVDNTTAVNYNGNNCPTAAPCVEIDLHSVSLDRSQEDLNGTGAYRYNMSGFIGLTKPVDWADCRFVIDGTVYTPSDANASGYANKQIWLYDPTNGSANTQGYVACDDTTPGQCKLIPFEGFWVELHGSTKNKSVKLLIPKE